MTLDKFLAKFSLGHIDLIKIDIEGAETDMLTSASNELLSKLGQITIEFHDFPYLDLEEKTKYIISRLESIGFYRIDFSRNRTDILFVNRNKVKVSLFKLILCKYIVKYIYAETFHIPQGSTLIDFGCSRAMAIWKLIQAGYDVREFVNGANYKFFFARLPYSIDSSPYDYNAIEKWDRRNPLVIDLSGNELMVAAVL